MTRYTWIALLLFGCSGDDNTSPVEKCHQLVSTLCHKFFECGAGTAFKDEADCEAKENERIGCADWTLPEGCTVDWGPFDQCLSDTSDASCSSLQSGSLPSSCASATQGSPQCPGAIFCGDHSSDSSNSSCTRTFADCQDGHSYSVSCDDNGCECAVDGASTQTAAGLTECTPDEALLNQACDWKLAVTYKPHDMAYMDLAPPPDLIPACIIDGTTYTPDTVNPQNECEICKPSLAATYWSANDGVACGNACGQCLSRQCAPVVLASGSKPQSVAVDADYVYYTDSSAGMVRKVPRGGGAAITLASGQYQPAGLVIDGTYAYYVSLGNLIGEVNKVPLAGGAAPTMLTSAGKYPRYLAIDSSNVYWTDSQANSVFKVSLNGGAAIPIASPQPTPAGIAVDTNNVYWATGDGKIMMQPLAGPSPTPTPLATNQELPSSLAFDSGYLYWATNKLLMRVPAGGGLVTTLNPGELQLAATGIALDSGYVYWVNSISNGAVAKVPIGGGSVVDLAHGMDYPQAVAVDSSCVYWTNGHDVSRAPK